MCHYWNRTVQSRVEWTKRRLSCSLMIITRATARVASTRSNKFGTVQSTQGGKKSSTIFLLSGFMERLSQGKKHPRTCFGRVTSLKPDQHLP